MTPLRRRRPATGVFAIAVALGFAIAGCIGPASVAAGPLVTVETRGGECFAAPCGSTFTIERDGTVHSADKPPNVVGEVPVDLLRTLDTLIATTDFRVIKSRPFTGECPTAFDGQELVYTFATPSGTETISTCEIEVDPSLPLFATVNAALVSVNVLPAS